MSKKAYKELRKKLKNEWIKPKGEYGLPSAIGAWLVQCGIQPTTEHTNILCRIMGYLPYPHQESDRLILITYLKAHKYKEYALTLSLIKG